MKYGHRTLGQLEALMNKLGGDEVVDQILSGAVEIVIKTIGLLKFISTFSASAVQNFVVKDHFKVDTSDGAEVKIVFLNDTFTKIFGEMTEENLPATTLRIHELKKSSLDVTIMAELGDHKETKLVHLWELLKKQPQGESGALITNGFANIFYVRDTNNALWVVNVDWFGGGWSVNAHSNARFVELKLKWHAGVQVFSRDLPAGPFRSEASEAGSH